jgi:hypothetical protein
LNACDRPTTKLKSFMRNCWPHPRPVTDSLDFSTHVVGDRQWSIRAVVNVRSWPLSSLRTGVPARAVTTSTPGVHDQSPIDAALHDVFLAKRTSPSAHEIRVGEHVSRARKTLIATGAHRYRATRQ